MPLNPQQLNALEELYLRAFVFVPETLVIRQYNVPFKCPNMNRPCNVHPETEPIWSALVDGPEVMIVGEAPSLGQPPLAGANISGSTNHPQNNPIIFSQGHLALRRFVERQYNCIDPYMTEIAKCGVARNNVNPIRFCICVKYFLQEEINILQPQVILGIGKTAFDWIGILELPQGTQAFYLHHFSNQNAWATLVEKEHLIWPIQTGCIPQGLKNQAIQNVQNGINNNPGLPQGAWNCIWGRRNNGRWLNHIFRL